jgi:hypothetical protein
MISRRSRLGWWVMAGLALFIAFYALAFGVLGGRMYQGELAASFHARDWAIRSHALLGALGLLLGPLQLRRDLLVRRRPLHRRLGRIYVGAALMTGATGLYVALYSHGGWITHVGFGLLGIGLMVCSARAYLSILDRQVARHREWMVRSYALLFAAVTLRIQLPLLAAAFGGFLAAYRLVAWSCWVPNLLLVELYLRRTRRAQAAQVAGLIIPVAAPAGAGWASR